MNLRTQKPGKSSKITRLHKMSRTLQREFRPYVKVTPSPDETSLTVIIGRTITVMGTIWMESSRFRANFSLPTRVHNAAPKVDPKEDRGKLAVFRTSTDKSEKGKGNRQVRISEDDLEVFKSRVFKLIQDILDQIGVGGGDDVQESFSSVILIGDVAEPKDAVGHIAERYGDGDGCYLCIETNRLGDESIIELFGPIENDSMEIVMPEGFRKIGSINDAENRDEAMDVAHKSIPKNGQLAEVKFDTVRVVGEVEGESEYAVMVSKESSRNDTVEVEASSKSDAESAALEIAKTFEFEGNETSSFHINVLDSEPLSHMALVDESTVNGNKWTASIWKTITRFAEVTVMATSEEDACNKAKTMAPKLEFKDRPNSTRIKNDEIREQITSAKRILRGAGLREGSEDICEEAKHTLSQYGYSKAAISRIEGSTSTRIA